MIMRSFFVFDVESVGLHGEGFAVGGGVYLGNGAVQCEFRFACPIDSAKGDDEGREWVKKNTPVLEVAHHTPLGIRDAFWSEWVKAKLNYPGIIMAADCGWPVEARFLCACIDDDLVNRRWNGPYPLFEIASVLVASGKDPLAKYSRTESEKPEHDPLADARQSARILSETLATLKCL